MPTLRLTKRRVEGYLDRDGIHTYQQVNDETKPYTVDYSGDLGSGETISTSAWDTSGLSSSGAANTSTTTSITITGTNAEIENTVTTSTGRTLERKFRLEDARLPYTTDYQD